MIGMLLRAPKLVVDIRDRRKRLTVDWVKLLGLGLPFLYLASTPVILYYVNFLSANFIMRIYYAGPFVISMAGVIAGYVLLASIVEKNATLDTKNMYL